MGGGGGSKNRSFTVYVLYGWPHTVNLYPDFSLEYPIMKIQELKLNCLTIFYFLDNNLRSVLFLELVFILAKSDGRQEL